MAASVCASDFGCVSPFSTKPTFGIVSGWSPSVESCHMSQQLDEHVGGVVCVLKMSQLYTAVLVEKTKY